MSSETVLYKGCDYIGLIFACCKQSKFLRDWNVALRTVSELHADDHCCA